MPKAIQELRAVSLKEERELLEIERSTQYEKMMRPVLWWRWLGYALVGLSAVSLALLLLAVQPYLPWWREQTWAAMLAIALLALTPSLAFVLAGMVCQSLSQTRKESIEASFIQLHVDTAVERAFFRWLGASNEEYLATRGSLSLGAAVRREVDREAALVFEVEAVVHEVLELMVERGDVSRILQSRNALLAAQQLMQFLADLREEVQVDAEDFARVEQVRAQLRAAVASEQPDNLIHLVSANQTPAE